MVRRHGDTPSPRPAGERPPVELLRLSWPDWVREDERPPDFWAGDLREWRAVEAFRRHLDAARKWRAEHGVSLEEWQRFGHRPGCDHAGPCP
jgi:hypothetical protein